MKGVVDRLDDSPNGWDDLNQHSPLDRYLRDTEVTIDQTKHLYEQGVPNTQRFWKTEPSPPLTPVRSPSPGEGWTGPQELQSGPSSPRYLHRDSDKYSPSPSALRSSPENYPSETHAAASTAFAEQFKYLICSSGLLEKDFVTSATDNGQSGIRHGEGSNEAFHDSQPDPSDDIGTPPDWRAFTTSAVMRSLRRALAILEAADTGKFVQLCRKRWDILLAGAALLGGLVIIVGLQRLLLYSVCLGAGSFAAELWSGRAAFGKSERYTRWRLYCRSHLKLLLAAGVAWVVMSWKVGLWRGMGSLVCLVVGGCFAELWLERAKRVPRLNFVFQHAQTVLAAPPTSQTTLLPSDLSSQRSQAMITLQSTLTMFAQLDITMSKSLSLLSPSPSQYSSLDNQEHSQKALRTALHRLLGNMTDHLAAVDSELKGKLDKSELKVLAEMYDITMDTRRSIGTDPILKRSRASADAGEANDDIGIPDRDSDGGMGMSVPAPRQRGPIPLQLCSPPSTIRPKRSAWAVSRQPSTIDNLTSNSKTSLPMSSTNSTPNHLSTHNTQHVSRIYHLDRAAPHALESGDRFTSLPKRTPRLSKRASWDSSTWSANNRAQDAQWDAHSRSRSGYDNLEFGSPLPLARSRSTGREISHEKRITEADKMADDEDGDSGSSPIGHLSSAGMEGVAASNVSHDDADPGSVEMMASAISSPDTSETSARQDQLRPLSLPASPRLRARPSSWAGANRSAYSTFPRRTSPLSGTAASELVPNTGNVSEDSNSKAPVPGRPKPFSSPKSITDVSRYLHQSRRSLDNAFAAQDFNPKRRLLQSMPYYPASSDSDSLQLSSSQDNPRFSQSPASSRSSSSHRRSEHVSHLQATRSRRATGSRRTSVHSISSIHSILPSSISRPMVIPHFSPIRPRSAQMATQHASPLHSAGHSEIDDSDGSVSYAQHHTPGGHVARPSVTRIPSISPLTTPALKAACLGIHLKRRKLACDLLALRWDEVEQGYWTEIADTLEKLRENVVKETGMVDIEREGVEAEVTLEKAVAKRASSLTPPWRLHREEAEANRTDADGNDGLYRPVHVLANGDVDYAPRSSPEEALISHLDNVQAALERIWFESAKARRSLLDPSSADARLAQLASAWASMRDNLGGMVRHLEKGKGSIQDLTNQARTGQQVENGIARAFGLGNSDESVPEFAREWDDDGATARSTSVGTAHTATVNDKFRAGDESELEDDTEVAEKLPPVGMDEVFEENLGPALRSVVPDLGKMSRDERMAMMRLAREQGLTLGEMMRSRSLGPAGQNAQPPQSEKEMRVQGEMVVGELKGVIGLIRDMKMGDRPPNGPQQGANEHRVPAPDPPRQIAPSIHQRLVDPNQTHIQTSKQHFEMPSLQPSFSLSDSPVEAIAPRKRLQDELNKAFVFPTREPSSAYLE